MQNIDKMHNIHNRPFDLNLLYALEALLREQSVTRAANRLNMTQSAMSHTLNRLRQLFEDPLFIRTGGAMRPTPKAELLQTSILDVMDRVRQDIYEQASFN